MVEILSSELGTALEAPVDAPGGSASEDAVALVSVHRPEPGETLGVPIEAGLLLVVEFNPTSAKFTLVGDDFVLTLEDGAQVVFEGLVSAAQGEGAPSLEQCFISRCYESLPHLLTTLPHHTATTLADRSR